ncbi:MAG TPA: hypothetical protein VFH55_06405 [Nitrospiria bacterium]|nr:hypothetical protein [Nitrospiria bacterium]
MPRTTELRPTALLLASVYLFLSGFMTVGAVPQEVHPGPHPNHAKQHSTLLCHWMCTASISVHSTDQPLPVGVREPTLGRPTLHAEPVLGHHSEFSFYIRPPPVYLA